MRQQGIEATRKYRGMPILGEQQKGEFLQYFFHGLDSLGQEVAGYLVVDVHDITNLFITKVLVKLEVDDLFLAGRELFQGPENAGGPFGMFLFINDKGFVADLKDDIFGESGLQAGIGPFMEGF